MHQVRQMLLHLPSVQGARQGVGLKEVTLQRTHGCNVVLHHHRRPNTRSILHTLRKLQGSLPHEDKHTRNHKTHKTRSHKTTKPQQNLANTLKTTRPAEMPTPFAANTNKRHPTTKLSRLLYGVGVSGMWPPSTSSYSTYT